MSPVLVRVRRDQLRESKFHCRRVWGDLDGMAQSMREHGILELPLVRRLQTTLADAPIAPDEPLEIVFGHRRNRGAGLAGLEEVDVIVREDLTESQALAIQMIENVQREDLHPLDEGDAYTRMLELGSSIEEIGASVGKSRSTIYGRLALAKLPELARKALIEGEMTVSVGLLLARYPASVHVAATKKLLAQSAAMSTGVAGAVLRQHFALSLKLAPFPKAAAKLVAAAGACTKCPKRSGVQAALFDETDVDNDMCLDAGCYRGKEAAHFNATAAKVEKDGGQVLSAGESKKVLNPYSGEPGWGSKYVAASQLIPGTGQTLAEVAKGPAKKHLVLAQGCRGPVLLLERSAAEELAKSVGGDLNAARKDDVDLAERRAEYEARNAAEKADNEQVKEALLRRAEAGFDDPQMLRVLLVSALERDYNQNGNELARRLELVDEGHPHGALYATFAALPDARLRAVIVELLLSERSLRNAYTVTGVELPPPVAGMWPRDDEPEESEPEESEPTSADFAAPPSEPPPASSPKPRARRGRAVSA